MEACVVICRTAKPAACQGRVLFINAVSDVTRERAQSFLTGEHIERIVKAYRRFEDDAGFAKVATLGEIRSKDANLSIPLYVLPVAGNGATGVEARPAGAPNLAVALVAWLQSTAEVRRALSVILEGRP
jgi:type I restriction enzyme M protein